MFKALKKLYLLLWKNFLIQRSHPIRTFFELIAPLLGCCLLAFFRNIKYPDHHPARFYKPFDIRVPVIHEQNSWLRVIIWSPNSEVLDKIMQKAMDDLAYRENITMIPVPFKSKAKAREYADFEFIKRHIVLAGVEFDDSLQNATTLPPEVNVVLRFCEPRRVFYINQAVRERLHYTWHTDRLFPMFQFLGPRNYKISTGALPNYHDEGFLGLQQAISFSIISYFKQQLKNITYNYAHQIEMQRFPHPPWTDDGITKGLQRFVSMIIMLSYAFSFVSLVKDMIIEKEKQLKEAMKMMGLSNWLHWAAWFIKAFLCLSIATIITVIFLKIKWVPKEKVSVLTYSNPLLIFIVLLLYILSVIMFAFAIGVFFSNATTAAISAGIAWFMMYVPFYFVHVNYYEFSFNLKMSSCLSFNTAMGIAFYLILALEGSAEGLQWHNLWKTVSLEDNIAIGNILGMLIFDSLIYLVIALYVEQVLPGNYGVSQPWYFLFTYSFWCGRSKGVDVEYTSNNTITDGELFEAEPVDMQPGITIMHLQKKYSTKKVSVHDLNFKMYKDQITVLLGHNGAGKTTTIHMLCGMFPPTSGTAIIEGCDIRTDMLEIRKSLGLCPQHNILFDDLTVKEHLYFFASLKGLSKGKAKNETKKYIEMLNLGAKADVRSSKLSGGLQRKLSVGIALCGGSKVVILDEPSSGMDPATRRTLWNLLQREKKGRTILLTTHLMDEADILGDRIAIMSRGSLQCCGSSFFLKKKYGAGYHLVMDVSPNCEVSRITVFLQNYIHDIEMAGRIGSELSYILSEEHVSIFEGILADLEKNMHNLGILSYGISITTLDEVFMKAGSDLNHEADELSVLGSPDTELNINKERSKHYRGCNKFIAMLMKRALTTYRSWLLFIIENIIPIFFITLALELVRMRMTITSEDLPKLKIDLNSYKNPITIVAHNVSNKYARQYINYLKQHKQNCVNWVNQNVSENLYRKIERNPTEVRLRWLVGASFEKNNVIKAWINNEPYHTPPLALQLVQNAILRKEVSPNHSIQFYNYPLPVSVQTKLLKTEAGISRVVHLSYNIGLSMALLTPFYIMFYIHERMSRSKHQQFIAGVDVLTFWTASFLWDLLMFTFTGGLIILVIIAYQEDGLKQPHELGRILLVLECFCFAMLPLTYIMSNLFRTPATGYAYMLLINLGIGLVGYQLVRLLESLEMTNISKPIKNVLQFFPLYILIVSVIDMTSIHSIQKLCNMYLDSCQENAIVEELIGHSTVTCRQRMCKQFSPCCKMSFKYYEWNSPGIGRYLFTLIVEGILFICILLLIEYEVHRFFMMLLKRKRKNETNPLEREDDDVVGERLKVLSIRPDNRKYYALLMGNVTKYYRKFVAVDNLSLALEEYECFGLLGINGAGKTTTFNMLTGCLNISFGNIWVNGYNIKFGKKKVYRHIGYCPQFDAFIDDLTCRETITIFCLLRGLNWKSSRILPKTLSELLHFEDHLDKQIKKLSGGNKRKLSTAVALIGNPDVILLDEPTAGMDPASKRFIWNVLCKVRDSGKCIVLTSHSMEECEALCTRLAIMVNGKLKCIGSVQHLKSKFASGYILTIKVKKTVHSENPKASDVEKIEMYVKINFPGSLLRERHLDMMVFDIIDTTIPCSKMFGLMEKGKQFLNIEDYSLNQSNLEQVFLSLAGVERIP